MAAPSNPINAIERSATLLPASAWTPEASYAVGSESDRVLMVAFGTEEGGGPFSVTAVNFNTSESFTEVLSISEGINDNSLWALVNPTNTTAAIDVTIDGSGLDRITAHIWYHSGAEQVIPSEGEASNSSAGASETAIAVDIITSGADRMIVASGGHGDGNEMAAGTGETLINSIIAGGSLTGAASYFMQASAGTRNMDFTFSASRRPSIVGVAIRPAVTAPTSTGAPTLEAFFVVASGTMQPSGTSVPALEALAMVSSGVQKYLATGAPTLEAMVMVSSGLQKLLATGAPVIEAMALVSGGLQKYVGTSAPALEALVLAAAGVMQPSGAGAPSIETMALVSTGVQKFLATGAPGLEELVMVAAGTAGAPPTGTGAPTFETLALAASAVMEPSGVGAPTLEDFLLAAVGVGPAVAGSLWPPMRRRRRPGR